MQQPAVTYWMNRLQDLPTTTPLFVSLNPHREPDPATVHASFDYAHPQFGTESVAAQQALAELEHVLEVSDRIAVLCAGEITGVITPEQATPEVMGSLMAGGGIA